MKVGDVEIEWLGHASFRITGDSVIYIDPFQIAKGDVKADIILITHEHYDHCSIEDIAKIVSMDTVIVTVADCQSKLSGLQFKDLKLVIPGQSIEVGDVVIDAVHAYNVDKKFHPRGNDWVGFVVTMNKKRVFHAGDTDNIPEMKELKDIDVALLPVSGTYVMTAADAADAVNAFKPKLAIPMHYGAGVAGTQADAETFKELSSVDVEVLEKSQ